MSVLLLMKSQSLLDVRLKGKGSGGDSFLPCFGIVLVVTDAPIRVPLLLSILAEGWGQGGNSPGTDPGRAISTLQIF